MEQYNSKYNFLLIKENEIGVFNSLPLCFRRIYDSKLFIIDYIVKHSCTGECKFKPENININHIPPFMEVLPDHLKENIYTVNDLIINNYFKSRNILCNEPKCVIDNCGCVLTFKL